MVKIWPVVTGWILTANGCAVECDSDGTSEARLPGSTNSAGSPPAAVFQIPGNCAESVDQPARCAAFSSGQPGCNGELAHSEEGVAMADRSDVMRRPPRVPLRPRSRRRWAVAAGIAALWALLLAGTGSLVVGTALLMLLAAVGVVCAVALRSLGINGDHPWARQLATRPWRDGSDVLRLGLRHVAEVFIVTPTGSLLAPNAIELLMNPDDLAALTETMDLEVINASATEPYSAQVTAHGARLASIGPVAASVTGDPAVPAGRYRFRQGRLPAFAPPDAYRAPSGSHLAPASAYSAPPADQLAPPDAYLARPADYPAPSAAYRVPPDVYLAPPDVDLAPPDVYLAPPDGDLAYPNGAAFPYAHDGRTRGEPAARTIRTGQLTVTEAVPAPLLRLVTGGSTAETR